MDARSPAGSRLFSPAMFRVSRARQYARQGVRLVCREHVGLTAVLTLALVTRVFVLRWWAPFPFGDTFNFIRIAQSLTAFTYPLHEKRLPTFPLAILAVQGVLPGVSWEAVAIGLSLLASLATLVVLYALGRTLRLNKTALLVGLLFLASYPPFLQYSIRGYADSTMLALLGALLLALLRARRARGAALVGVLAGALALTRTEGALVVLGLTPLVMWRWRSVPRKLVVALLVLLLTLSPYILLSLRIGRSVLPQAYLAETGEAGSGYGAASLADFWERSGVMLGRVGLLAAVRVPVELAETLGREPFSLPRRLTQLASEPSQAAAALAVPGMVFLLFRRRLLDVLTVAIPFLLLGAAAAWYAPYVRYDAFVFPWVAFAAAVGGHAGFQLLSRGTAGQAGTRLRRAAAAFALFLAVFVWFLSYTQQAVEGMKKSRHRERAYYDAVRFVRSLPGVVAFEERRGITEAYFSDRAVYSEELFESRRAGAARFAALRSAGAALVVAQPSRAESLLAFLGDEPFTRETEIVRRFEVQQGNHDRDVAVVYRLQPEPSARREEISHAP